MQGDQRSRQLEIALSIDRPEPKRLDCVTPEDKLYKAHCILLDVLSRQHRGIALAGDAENLTCVAEVVTLLGNALCGALMPPE